MKKIGPENIREGRTSLLLGRPTTGIIRGLKQTQLAEKTPIGIWRGQIRDRGDEGKCHKTICRTTIKGLSGRNLVVEIKERTKGSEVEKLEIWGKE